MAQSTTVISAKDCEIQVDDGVGGSLTDISGSSNHVEINMEQIAGEYYTFDGDWRAVQAGKKKWSGTVNACYSETDGEAFDVMWTDFAAAGSVSISISPAGGTSGDWEWTGEVLFTTAPVVLDAAGADPILVDFNFEGDGTLTKGTAT